MVRKLVVDAAKELVPSLDVAGQVSEAVDLQSCPNTTRSLPRPSSKPLDLSYRDLPTLFVDPVAGCDANPGTADAPVATIQRAVLLSRALGPRVSRAVALVDTGIHHLSQPVQLSPADSGLKIGPASPSAKPVVSGAVPLSDLSWAPVANKTGMGPPQNGVNNAWGQFFPNGTTLVPGLRVFRNSAFPATCSAACSSLPICTSWTWHDSDQGAYALLCVLRTDGYWSLVAEPGHVSGQKLNVYAAPIPPSISIDASRFDQLFLGAAGGWRRLTRARYPSPAWSSESTGLWTVPATGYVSQAKSWVAPSSLPSATVVNATSPALTGTQFNLWSAGVGGTCSGYFVPPRSYWCTASPTGGGGSTFRQPLGVVLDPATFSNRTWTLPTAGSGVEAVLHTYHCGHWGSDSYKIDGAGSSVSPSNLTLSFSEGGWQEARGCDSGAEWYVENVLEELDSPGEWFYDPSERMLFVYANTTVSPSEWGTLYASQAQELFVVEGSQRSPVLDVSLSGLTLQHTSMSLFAQHEVPSGGDWALTRVAGVRAEGVTQFSVSGLEMRSMGGNGLVVGSFARQVTVEDSTFAWLGASAMVFVGDMESVDLTDGNQPIGILVNGTMVRDCGVYQKQSAAVFIGNAGGVTVRNSVFFNLPRAGINVNDGAIGGHLFTRLVLFNTVRETGDHGPINTWNRMPQLATPFGTSGPPSLLPTWSAITSNLVVGNYHSVWPLDHDDGSAYWNDTQNVLVYGGYKNFLGHSKRASGNVYVYPDAPRQAPPPLGTGSLEAFFTMPYCLNSDGQQVNVSGWGEAWEDNVCFIRSANVYELGNCDPSSITQLVPATRNNQFYTDGGDITFKCGLSSYSLEEWQQLGMDAGSSVQATPDVKFVDATARKLLGLPL